MLKITPRIIFTSFLPFFSLPFIFLQGALQGFLPDLIICVAPHHGFTAPPSSLPVSAHTCPPKKGLKPTFQYLSSDRGKKGGCLLPFSVSGTWIYTILLIFVCSEHCVAVTHPLAPPVSSPSAVSKGTGFPAQRPRGHIQNWAEKEAELKINVSAS